MSSQVVKVKDNYQLPEVIRVNNKIFEVRVK
jgi:hypothetical protein